jgi:hypothetical protein
MDPFIKEAMEFTLPHGIVNEINGYSRSYYTLEGHMDAIRNYDHAIIPAPDDQHWTRTVNEVKLYFTQLPRVSVLSATPEQRGFGNVSYHEGTSAGYGYHDPTQLHQPTKDLALVPII